MTTFNVQLDNEYVSVSGDYIYFGLNYIHIRRSVDDSRPWWRRWLTFSFPTEDPTVAVFPKDKVIWIADDTSLH